MRERIQADAVKLSAADTDGSGLRTIQLLPWGKFETKGKGTIIVDQDGVDETVRAFSAHGTELPCDIDHAGLDLRLPASERGAVGWLTRVWGESGKGLFALCRWTDRGRELIRSGAYAYVSPVVLVDEATRRIQELHSAAVTNKPAVGGQVRLAANQGSDPATPEQLLGELKALLERKGVDLGDAPTFNIIIRAAMDLIGGGNSSDTIAASVRARLGLDKNADAATTLIAFDARCVESVEAAQAGFAETLVNRAIADRKISERDAERIKFLHTLALSDRKTAEAFVDNLQPFPFPPQGRTYQPMTVSATGRERGTTIINALREFRSNPQHAKLTSEKAFVDLALRDAKLSPMTDDDVKSFERLT